LLGGLGDRGRLWYRSAPASVTGRFVLAAGVLALVAGCSGPTQNNSGRSPILICGQEMVAGGTDSSPIRPWNTPAQTITVFGASSDTIIELPEPVDCNHGGTITFSAQGVVQFANVAHSKDGKVVAFRVVGVTDGVVTVTAHFHGRSVGHLLVRSLVPGATTTTATAAPVSAFAPGAALSTKLTPVPALPASAPAESNLSGLAFLNTKVGYASSYGCPGCQAPLDATTDGGLSWHRIASPTGAAGADSAFQIRVGPGQLWMYGPKSDNGLGNVVYRSLDGGRTWDQLEGICRLLDMAIEPGSIWALVQDCDATSATACQTALVVSTDEGVTWAVAAHQPEVASPAQGGVTPVVLQLLRLDTSHAWVLSLSEIGQPFVLSRTTDGGQAWTAFPGPPRTCAGEPASLAAYDSNRLWLACGGNPATDMEYREVATSIDGGATWSVDLQAIVSGQMQSLTVAGPNSAFLAECRNTVEGSFDGGRHWQEVIPFEEGDPGDSCNGPILFMNPLDGWAGGQRVSGASIVWRTNDGGHDWTPVSLP
jgi:photosystem II stability/assembly factor-like uncharacterized protein